MKKYAPVVAMLMLVAVSAFAGLSGASTDAGLGSLWTEVSGWLIGAPGKILALGFLVMGIWMARQGQFLWFFGGLLLAVVVTLLPGIINTKFSACF